MNFLLLDTETTGINTETDRILEIAWVVVNSVGTPLTAIKDHYCKHTTTIPSEAKAVHHITESVVENAPLIEEAFLALETDMDEYDVECAVAHNGAFDFPLILAALNRCGMGSSSILDCKTLCTLRLARRLFPDTDKHNMQYLRYELGLDRPEFHGGTAHSADHDVLVLTALFSKLKEVSPYSSDEELILESDKPFLLPSMPFGKHKGVPFKSLPTSYLRWLKTIDLDLDLLHTVDWYLNM